MLYLLEVFLQIILEAAFIDQSFNFLVFELQYTLQFLKVLILYLTQFLYFCLKSLVDVL